MNSKELEKKFVHNFIRKGCRERSLWILNNKKKRTDFINQFNHSWDKMIAEKHLIKLDTTSNFDTYQSIKTELRLNDTDLCYVISYNNYDGQFIEFKSAFEKCQKSQFAILIISENGNKFYLKTEQVIGASCKFLGNK